MWTAAVRRAIRGANPHAAARRSVLRGVTALALAATAVVLVPALPAQADTRPPFQRCQRLGTPDAQQTTVQAGNQIGASFPEGDDPQNIILPGDVVKVTITGSIRTDFWGHSVGPDGTGVTAGSGWPFPNQAQYSSVARWNSRGAGWVGVPMQTTSLSFCTLAPSWPDGVRLLYYINDPGQGDNAGAFTIRTDVYWGPEPR